LALDRGGATGGPPYLRATADGVEILVHVQPRASRTKLVGEHGGRLKIALAAPPVDGAANDELLQFLASTLGVGRRDVEHLKGLTGRQKIVRVASLTAEELAARLT
jgi:uncharacterized protein (TIGR00251 family)